jgi:hypothetical protein
MAENVTKINIPQAERNLTCVLGEAAANLNLRADNWHSTRQQQSPRCQRRI